MAKYFSNQLLPANFQKYVNKQFNKISNMDPKSLPSGMSPKNLINEIFAGAQAALEEDRKENEEKEVIIDSVNNAELEPKDK